MSDQPVSLAPTPAGYAEWLIDLESRIHTAQQRATLTPFSNMSLLSATKP